MKIFDWSKLFEKDDYMAKLSEMYERAGGAFERRVILRQYYMDAMPEIIARARQDLRARRDVYPFDFLGYQFTPNEYALCQSIRSRPLPMYPEFPVLNYFVDFGNPYLRIALEADSKEFHTDEEKDINRDTKLLQVGWKTFRVSYEENVTPTKEIAEIGDLMLEGLTTEASDELENRMLHTSDGVVDAIDFFYFMLPEERARRIRSFPQFLRLADETLKKHRLVDFDLPNVG